MNRLFTVFTSVILFAFLSQDIHAQPCSDAGTAATPADSICFGDSATLVLSGYVGAIQWQSFNGTIWVDETGPGATTDYYQTNITSSTDFRAVVTAAGCSPDTSNTVSIIIGVSAPTTTGDTRCGYGPVTLTTQSPGTIRWYDVPTGGTPIDTGASFTVNVAATTTFYAAATIDGNTGITPMPNQATTYSNWARGYLFTAPIDFLITGLFVPTGNGSDQNVAVVKFDNNIPPPFFSQTTNAFTVLFLTQNNTTSGVIPASIQILAGDVIGVLATRSNGPGTDVNSYANGPYTTFIDGTPMAINRMGMQQPLSNNQPSDIWQIASGSISRLEIHWEVGCESVRTGTIGTVNPSTPISVVAGDSALCAGQSTTITVSSNNPNYSYTWSPAAGLSGTTGTTVTATPNTPTNYFIVADDGTCGAIDSMFIDVGPASDAGIASVTSDTICLGNEAFLSLTNSVGGVQWQSFDGSSWINETGPGNDSTTYAVSPIQDIIYRAIVTSGGCDPDTSVTLSITVLSIVNPILSDTSICGGGNVSLTAIGTGNFNWYDDSTSATPFFTGPTYSYNATSTDTFWVEAFGGADYNIGPVNPGIGNQTNGTSNNIGCAFDVFAGCVIESVKVFPQQAGIITVNLRQTQGGQILATYTTNVTAFVGQDLPLDFLVGPGVNYRLELAAGSVACTRNTSGASYPYQTANGPLEITGYFNPNFGTGGSYYWFYDWKVSEGCKSDRMPVVVTVNPYPPTPTIGQLGNILVSSAPSGNQWLLNGTIIPGETGQSLTITQIGTYTVAVTENGCTSLSPPFVVTTIGLSEINGISFDIFPNPASDHIILSASKPVTFSGGYRIMDMTGKELLRKEEFRKGMQVNEKISVDELAAGNYFLEIFGDSGKARIKFQVGK